jgi:hypothetical protein
MGVLRVLTGQGDRRVIWDEAAVRTGDPEALAALSEAERIFRDHRAAGATAVRAQPGQPAERIEQFDPTAEQLLLIPRVVGG